jgi:hypothetical protein
MIPTLPKKYARVNYQHKRLGQTNYLFSFSSGTINPIINTIQAPILPIIITNTYTTIQNVNGVSTNMLVGVLYKISIGTQESTDQEIDNDINFYFGRNVTFDVTINYTNLNGNKTNMNNKFTYSLNDQDKYAYKGSGGYEQTQLLGPYGQYTPNTQGIVINATIDMGYNPKTNVQTYATATFTQIF